MTLEVKDGVLASRFEKHDGHGGWELRITDLVLIAEYTTNEGPYLDDYFLVFWVKQQGELLKAECSFYADGRDEALTEVGRVLGTELELGLASSTEWNSRVVWPEALQGKPYYEFSNVPRVGFWQEILSGFIGDALEYKVTAELREYLKGQKQLHHPGLLE
jgi:hypothetical protein